MLRIIYFVFQSIQKFIKSIQMSYLHEGPISKAHGCTHNGSSSDADSTLVPKLHLIWIHYVGLFFVLLMNLLQDAQS
jgi:hypothetical protein